MKKVFEIKSHDGPGRLGKINNNQTPILFNIDNLKIAPSEGSAYNIDKEIALLNVKETIKLSQKNKESFDIGVIQGSKYLDLRIKCLKELEKQGYNGFIIANSDDLLLHPKNLVEIIVTLRENMNPSSYLIFPYAEASFIPILAYMGIDGFLNYSAEYYSYINCLMTPTKTYELDKYTLFENISREKLVKYNNKTLDFVLKEVRAHMKNRSLRNLVEERANTSPQNKSVLRILDKNYMGYLLKYTQLY